MTLAIFDLDNTLLDGDSDYLWGQYLVKQGLVDAGFYERENQRFYDDYREGRLDIFAFLTFSLRPLAETPMAQLLELRNDFIEQVIEPIILPKGRRLIEDHRRQGHTLMIITATNRFVTEPIARAIDVEHLLATEAEMLEGRYTGRPTGTPCFREGKVQRLHQWLAATGASLTDSWFYSDSHNDLALLEAVEHPVAIDPDDPLAQHAEMKGWPILSLRDPA